MEEIIKRENNYNLIDNKQNLPAYFEEDFNLLTCKKVPLTKLSNLGIGFEPLTSAIQAVTTGEGGSGIYYVNTMGKTMFNFKGSNEFVGSLKTTEGTVGGGQAHLTQLACNPTMIFMAIALSNINDKLDSIQEIQKDILELMILKDKSEMRGSLIFLSDIFNNYKNCWNNYMYRNNHYMKVVDIKEEATKKIVFYKSKIKKIIGKSSSFIHGSQDVNKQLNQAESDFADYNLALYLYSFSSFLEVMLSENYTAEYLSNISNEIEALSYEYRELYTKCYDKIEKDSNSSIQASLLKGFADINTIAGKTIAKIPVISNTQIDETLISAGSKIENYSINKTEDKMKKFIERQSSQVKPFIENINMINNLQNKPLQLAFDNENIYFNVIE